MQQHPTVKIEIDSKLVDIDVDIVPVVQWFNRFPGVKTRWSCQGGLPVAWLLAEEPYVVFFCNNLESLQKIAQEFKEFGSEDNEQNKIVNPDIFLIYSYDF